MKIYRALKSFILPLQRNQQFCISQLPEVSYFAKLSKTPVSVPGIIRIFLPPHLAHYLDLSIAEE